jgi:endonuclease-3
VTAASPHPEVQALADQVRQRLRAAIPEPKVELDFENPWQLLMATILAAQATDKKINEITPALFARFPDAAALAAADLTEVEALVKQSGFYRSKAKRIVDCSKALVERHRGRVPKQMKHLVKLPGVARKTANVVLGMAYGVNSGVVVDTHVGRVSRRLELTVEEDPVKVEEELLTLFPKRDWTGASHRLVLHGRYVCQAKKPRCGRCPLHEICASATGEKETRGWKKRAAWEGRLVASKGAVDAL